jgi:hypothetical protein
MKLYLGLVVRTWQSLSTDTKMVEIVDTAMGYGFCPIFTSKEDAISAGFGDNQILEVETEVTDSEK